MRVRQWWLFWASVGCSADDVDDTGQRGALMPGVNEFTLTQVIDGDTVERRFLVHAPSGFDASSRYPLLFAFHGLGGTGDDWVGRLAHQVNAGAFIGVYPDGHLNSWNTGQEESHADDVAFVESVMSEVVHFPGIQPERPVAMGASNGGGMVHKLAMDSELFVGIAALSTALTEVALPDASAPVVSVMQIHGTLDDVCPYAGGESDIGHVFLPAEESAAVWAEHNGCSTQWEELEVDFVTTSMTWSECSDDVTVVHYRLDGVGHGVPDDISGDTVGMVWSFLADAR